LIQRFILRFSLNVSLRQGEVCVTSQPGLELHKLRQWADTDSLSAVTNYYKMSM